MLEVGTKTNYQSVINHDITRNHPTVLQGGGTTVHPHQQRTSSPYAAHPHQRLVLPVFWAAATPRGAQCYLFVVCFLFLWENDKAMYVLWSGRFTDGHAVVHRVYVTCSGAQPMGRAVTFVWRIHPEPRSP